MWYSGGKLAPDLTLPKLRHRWDAQTTGSAEGPAAPLTPAERAAIWDHVTRTAAAATEQIRQLSITDPGLAADAAWAAADTFHAAASALGSRVLRQAADSDARAARAPYGRVPHRTPAGMGCTGRPGCCRPQGGQHDHSQLGDLRSQFGATSVRRIRRDGRI